MPFFTWWNRNTRRTDRMSRKYGDTATTREWQETFDATPTVRYVNSLFVWLVQQNNRDEALTLLPDMELPVVSDSSEQMLLEYGGTFDYRNVVNRLQVMCNLNPWPCNIEQEGIAKIRMAYGAERNYIDADMRIQIQPRNAAVRIEIARIAGRAPLSDL